MGDSPSQMTTVHVLSDSTGNLAHHILAALLTQFPPDSFRIRFWTFLRNAPLLADGLNSIAKEGGIILHAVVSPESKEQIADFCRRNKIPSKDLTGLFVEFLAEQSGLTPSDDWRSLHKVDEAYLRKIQAIEFTLQHDDGLGLETIGEAEIVLVGISRTSKTPTSIYLSQLGYRTANIALAKGVEPPRELAGISKGKVVGLTIDPTRLIEIRRTRQTEWKMASTSYDEMENVRDEVIWGRKLFTRLGWPILDVTNNAIEETASRILDLLHLSRDPFS